MYQARFTLLAAEDIKDLPKGLRNALKKEITGKILKDPAGCSEELQRDLQGFRSYPWGKYRVVFRIYEDLKIVAVVGVEKKPHQADTDVYKKLEDLARSGKLADAILSAIKMLPKP